MANRACNLECVTDHDGGDEVVEFVGPVKIILVNQPRNLYLRKRFAAAFIVLSHMMMGAATMTVLYYTLSYKKPACLVALHIFLGTFGLQICMPSAILSLHKLSGSTAPVKLAHRQFEHTFLHIVGILCTLLGLAASFFSGYFEFSIHCFFGCAAGVLAILNAINGFGIYDYWDTNHMEFIRKHIIQIHSLLGILAFVMSSACFVSGLVKPSFTRWTAVPEMSTFSVIFCLFYTLVILYKPIKELIN